MAYDPNASYIDNVITGMTPNLKEAQSGMYEYLQQMARRMGTAGAMQQASQAVAPYAEQAAQYTGDLAFEAAQADEQKRQYEEQLAEQQRQFDIQQENWQTQFDAYQQQQEIANMLAMFEYSGWTPELMEMLGYGDLSGMDMDDMNRLLEDLGFMQPQGMQDTNSGTSNVPLTAANNWGGQTGLIYG